MLSIVIPVYNRFVSLQQCLAGLLMQVNAPKFEVIVVDDGSTDNGR